MGQLTDAVIRSAPPGTIWDTNPVGLGVRSGKTSKTFIVQIGGGRKKKIGRYPLMSLAQARAIAKTMLAERQLGKVLPTHTAFEDARKEFLDDCRERIKSGDFRASTLAQYEWHLNLFPWKRQSIADVTRKEIERVLKQQSPSVREHLDRVGRTFFRWCVRKDMIDRSPMEKIDKPPPGKSRERALSEDELKKVYKAASKLENPVQRIAWLLLRTGQRPGELRRLQWAFISSRGHPTITLPGPLTKNGREHVFPISEETHATLMAFPKIDDSPYLFPATRAHVRGKPTECLTIGTKVWAEFQKACGVTGFTRHDLRRTMATMWAERLQIPPHLIERMLNHVSGEVSGVAATYNRARYLEELRGCVVRWEAFLKKL